MTMQDLAVPPEQVVHTTEAGAADSVETITIEQSSSITPPKLTVTNTPEDGTSETTYRTAIRQPDIGLCEDFDSEVPWSVKQTLASRGYITDSAHSPNSYPVLDYFSLIHHRLQALAVGQEPLMEHFYNNASYAAYFAGVIVDALRQDLPETLIKELSTKIQTRLEDGVHDDSLFGETLTAGNASYDVPPPTLTVPPTPVQTVALPPENKNGITHCIMFDDAVVYIRDGSVPDVPKYPTDGPPMSDRAEVYTVLSDDVLHLSVQHGGTDTCHPIHHETPRFPTTHAYRALEDIGYTVDVPAEIVTAETELRDLLVAAFNMSTWVRNRVEMNTREFTPFERLCKSGLLTAMLTAYVNVAGESMYANRVDHALGQVNADAGRDALSNISISRAEQFARSFVIDQPVRGDQDAVDQVDQVHGAFTDRYGALFQRAGVIE